MATTIALSPAALGKAKRQAAKRTSPRALTPRVKAAIEALVWGKATSIQAAAEAAKLTDRALREAFTKPEVRTYYQQQLDVLRNGGKARSIRVGLELMDDKQLQETAAGQKVRLDSAKFISGEDGAGGVHVNVGVSVQSLPGYRIDVPYDQAAIGRALAQAGSAGAIGSDVVEHLLPEQGRIEAKPLAHKAGVATDTEAQES